MNEKTKQNKPENNFNIYINKQTKQPAFYFPDKENDNQKRYFDENIDKKNNRYTIENKLIKS